MAPSRNVRSRRRWQPRRHPLETALSLVVLVLIAWVVWSTGAWLFTAADWSVVSENLPLFAVGSYPAEERWRPMVWLLLLVVITVATLLQPVAGSRWPSAAGPCRWDGWPCCRSAGCSSQVDWAFRR